MSRGGRAAARLHGLARLGPDVGCHPAEFEDAAHLVGHFAADRQSPDRCASVEGGAEPVGLLLALVLGSAFPWRNFVGE